MAVETSGFVSLILISSPLKWKLKLHHLYFTSFDSLFLSFQLAMEGKYPGDPFNFSLKAYLMEKPSKFAKDAMDGILLSLKGNADSCYLDILVEVCLFFVLSNLLYLAICFYVLILHQIFLCFLRLCEGLLGVPPSNIIQKPHMLRPPKLHRIIQSSSSTSGHNLVDIMT